jgi:outer membrane protein OmpU
MKKILLGTTALVAAAGFAGIASAQAVKSGAPSLSIAGEIEFDAAYFDNDGVANDRSFDFWTGSDLTFSPSWTHDNGLTVTGRIDLETATSAGNFNTDEVSITFASASFGTIILGDDDGPIDSLRVNGPLTGDGIWDGTASDFASNNPGIPLDGGDSGDNTKVFYSSAGIPMGGFVLGVALTPVAGAGGTGKVGTQVETSLDNEVELGVQWGGSIAGVDVLVGGGYVSAENNTPGVGLSPQGYNLGANVTFGAFTVGAGYNESDDFGADFESTNVGVSYSMGAWTFGGNWGVVDRTSASDGEAYGIGTTYVIADGLKANADLVFYDNHFTNQDSTVLMLGTVVSF